MLRDNDNSRGDAEVTIYHLLQPAINQRFAFANASAESISLKRWKSNRHLKGFLVSPASFARLASAL
ncbi:hypothetical protein EYF80_038658 [Liparis tanakae]|uniref:Uncharacterized protein n=1 Tax=Liparis tanakae TaxID=230148 RepID=A0A4Z2GC53_9TELE|nr:hypothetical protein EYF80_038658 [Liparis tanakae]